MVFLSQQSGNADFVHHVSLFLGHNIDGNGAFQLSQKESLSATKIDRMLCIESAIQMAASVHLPYIPIDVKAQQSTKQCNNVMTEEGMAVLTLKLGHK